MNILDRHLARRYVANIAALLVVLFSFVVGVDVFLNVRSYVEVGHSLATEDPTVLEIVAKTGLSIINLWGPRLLQLFNYLIGLVLVVAMGFTCVGLVRRRELVAALASGLSLHRLALPIVGVAALFTGFQALNQEFLVPRVAHLLPRDVDDVLDRELQPFRVLLLRDGAGRLFYAERFEPGADRMTGVHIWERDESGRVTRRLRAEEAVWTGRQWRLEGGRARFPGDPERVEPVEAVRTDLDPTTILVRRVEGFGQNLSWRRINQVLSQSETPLDEQTRRRLNRIRFGRVSIMASNLLILLIALPFFMTRVPMNMVRQSMRCAPIVVLGLIGAVIGVASPVPGLPVWVAVFFPPLVMAPLAIASLTNMRT